MYNSLSIYIVSSNALTCAKFYRMIQRIQTIYFIAIIVICVMTCSGTILSSMETAPGLVKGYTLNALHLKTYENGNLVSTEIQYILIAIVAVIIGWTINIISGFKNRKRQMTHAKINFVFIGLLIVMLFVTGFTKMPNFELGTMTMKSAFSVAFLIFMVYLNARALMMIRKDEELVKSADRIR